VTTPHQRSSIEPLVSRLLLLSPERVCERLAAHERAGLVECAPNPWQLTLGILRMWHRVIFRSDTIGTSRDLPVRSGARARLLAFRPLRFPFLVVERAIAPWDLTGLYSSPERVMRHLMGAHHDGAQFVYDLELLAAEPVWLERLRDEAKAVVEGTHPRGEWLRDLVVYERYHENLLEAVERALAGESTLSAEERRDPDLTLQGYLSWCARQPETPAETFRAWRARRFTLSSDPRHWRQELDREVPARAVSPACEVASC
jgi:hypothetical protein